MSQAIDLPFTKMVLEMLFLTSTSVQYHCSKCHWESLGILPCLKGNQGINTDQVLPKITASPTNPFLIYQSEAQHSINMFHLCQHSGELQMAWLIPQHPSYLYNKWLSPDIIQGPGPSHEALFEAGILSIDPMGILLMTV